MLLPPKSLDWDLYHFTQSLYCFLPNVYALKYSNAWLETKRSPSSLEILECGKQIGMKRKHQGVYLGMDSILDKKQNGPRHVSFTISWEVGKVVCVYMYVYTDVYRCVCVFMCVYIWVYMCVDMGVYTCVLMWMWSLEDVRCCSSGSAQVVFEDRVSH